MYTPERGRFLVASRDIDVGEWITHEEAIVSCVKMNSSLSHCYNCQKDTRIRPIPCDRCAAVVFCSFDCKSKSEFRWVILIYHNASFYETIIYLHLLYDQYFRNISFKTMAWFTSCCLKALVCFYQFHNLWKCTSVRLK